MLRKAEGTVSPVNYNAPGQVVISGETAALDRAIVIARARSETSCEVGGQRAFPFTVDVEGQR